MNPIRRIGSSPNLKIHYRKDQSRADYLPLNPNPEEPLPVIPITGAGDMYRAVYDQNLNGRADRVDYVQIAEVDGLQTILNDLANQGGGDGGKEVVTVTNNGGDSFLPGHPVCQNGTAYMRGASLQPRNRVLGLAIEASNPGDPLKIQLSGYFSQPVASWDQVLDTVGGLGINSTYFVNSDRKLSPEAPTLPPEYVLKIGHSLNTTNFLIDLDIAIKL